MEKNIVIIGFMGAGKTSVGKILADSMGYAFYDTDEIIIKRENNKSIRQIFDTKGEDYFREVEKNVVKEMAKRSNSVIATGGGVVKDKNNMDLLRQNGVVVYLKCAPEVVLKRIGNKTDRPVIYNKSAQEIEDIMKEREVFYANHDILIDVSSLTPIDAAKAIMVAYQKWIAKEKKNAD